jgi:hypothetical protein
MPTENSKTTARMHCTVRAVLLQELIHSDKWLPDKMVRIRLTPPLILPPPYATPSELLSGRQKTGSTHVMHPWIAGAGGARGSCGHCSACHCAGGQAPAPLLACMSLGTCRCRQWPTTRFHYRPACGACLNGMLFCLTGAQGFGLSP